MKHDLSQVKVPYSPDTAQLVIFATSIVGIGHITVQTVELFIVRLLMYSRLIVDLPLTVEDIRAFIGLSTDVPFMPDELWLCHLQHLFCEDQHILPIPMLYRTPGDVILASGGMPNQWQHAYLVPPSIVSAAGVTDMPFVRMYVVYRNMTGTRYVVAETDERLYRELTFEEMEAFHKAAYFFDAAQEYHKRQSEQTTAKYDK